MITGEMVEKAIEEGHTSSCLNGCIHAEGLSEARDAITERITKSIVLGLEGMAAGSSLQPEDVIFVEGLHVGYRLAQIEQDARVNQVLQKQQVQ